MSTEQNKAIVRRFFEAHAAELLAPDLVVHLPGAPTPLTREVFLQHMTMFNTAFSDTYTVVEDQIAEGDKVATRITWRGIHSSNFQGLPPTGKQVAVSATIVQRIKEGKIVEHWPLFDQQGLMQQLGLIPSSQAAR